VSISVILLGTAFLAVGLWRVLAYHLTNNHHLGLEAGILYWHFVDVVWLFLFYPYIIEDAKVK
jgi:cytochrome c oxidase subunit 3